MRRGGEVRDAGQSARPDGERTSEPEDGVWTVLRMIRWSGEYLADRGVERGRLDAEHLLAHVLDLSRLQLYLQYERPLTAAELAEYKPLLLRRAGREPLQYILGTAPFRNLELLSDERVLIPRPETEQLVEAVLEWAGRRSGRGDRPAGPDGSVNGRGRAAGARGALSALDVGTGSGCIALALAQEGPFEAVVATDPSEEALEVARENARRNDLAEAVDFRMGALFEPVATERFDVVVSNPPYVAEPDEDELEPEVKGWEPRRALFAGADGLDVLRPLVVGAPDHLEDRGLLAVEVGLEQAPAVADLIRRTGLFGEPEVKRDLAGRPRMVLAERTTRERRDEFDDTRRE